MKTEGAVVPRSERLEINSALLRVIVANLDRPGKPNVLDLGPACGANVDFLSVSSCKVYVEDLYSSLSSLHRGDDFVFADVIPQILSYGPAQKFDLILAWNLPNYLMAEELQFVLAHLSGFCNPGTLCFSLSSTAERVPYLPGIFRIRSADTIVYEADWTDTRLNYKHSSNELQKMLTNSSVKRSVLHRSGFQEDLLVINP